MSNKYEPIEQVTPEKKGGKPIEPETVSVCISKDLHSRIKKRLNEVEFASVDSYVEYVLQQIILELENGDNQGGPQSEPSAFSKKDQDNVEQRLRNLGYI